MNHHVFRRYRNMDKICCFLSISITKQCLFYCFSLQNIAKKNFISREFETWLYLPIKAQYFCMSHVFLILYVNLLTLHRKKLLLLIHVYVKLSIMFWHSTFFKTYRNFSLYKQHIFCILISWFLPSLFHDKHVILKLRQSSADFSQWKGNPFKKIVKAV